MADILDRPKAALVDRYAVEQESAGGMATVYLAVDLKHHRKVLVKVLRPAKVNASTAWETTRQCTEWPTRDWDST